MNRIINAINSNAANQANLLALANVNQADNAQLRAVVRGLGVDAAAMSDADLDALAAPARARICNEAAKKYYLAIINGVGPNAQAKLNALKLIGELHTPVDNPPAIKVSLDAARAALDIQLNPGLAMITEDAVITELRQRAAEKFVALTIGSINKSEHLLALKNARTVAEFRAALKVGPAHDPADPVKMLALAADSNDQTVLREDQIKKLKKEIVEPRHHHLVRVERFNAMNEDQNAKENGGKTSDANAATFMSFGYIKPSEFKKIVLPKLIEKMLEGKDPAIIASEKESSQNSIKIHRDDKGLEQGYTVTLPQEMKLTEKAVGEKHVESTISSTSDSVTPYELYLTAARNLFYRYKEVLKLNPALHPLKITQAPTYVDKTGKQFTFAEIRVDFERALRDAGFVSFSYAPSATFGALLPDDPALAAAAAAPAVVVDPAAAPAPAVVVDPAAAPAPAPAPAVVVDPAAAAPAPAPAPAVVVDPAAAPAPAVVVDPAAAAPAPAVVADDFQPAEEEDQDDLAADQDPRVLGR